MKEKIWGVYNTWNNPEIFDTFEEIDIWKKIDNLGNAIFWEMHNAGQPRASKITSKDLIDALYNLEYLVYYTRRFGVEFSKEPSSTEHIERSESYNAWFTFWHNHFESMPPEIYNQFINDKFNGKDISKYMPSSNWKDSLGYSLQKNNNKNLY